MLCNVCYAMPKIFAVAAMLSLAFTSLTASGLNPCM
jgi:hypothetical protein